MLGSRLGWWQVVSIKNRSCHAASTAISTFISAIANSAVIYCNWNLMSQVQ